MTTVASAWEMWEVMRHRKSRLLKPEYSIGDYLNWYRRTGRVDKMPWPVTSTTCIVLMNRKFRKYGYPETYKNRGTLNGHLVYSFDPKDRVGYANNS